MLAAGRRNDHQEKLRKSWAFIRRRFRVRSTRPRAAHRQGNQRTHRTPAKKLGYYPNAAAASLRTGRSKLIGVFLPDISNPVFSPILSGIAEVTSDSGFATIVADVGTESRSQTEMMFELVAPRVEGLILATVSRNDDLVQQCITKDFRLSS